MKFSELKKVMTGNDRLDLLVMHSSKDGGLLGMTAKSCYVHAVPDDTLDCDVGHMYVTAGGSIHITLLKND